MKQKDRLKLLLLEVEELILYIYAMEKEYIGKLKKVHKKYKQSARNLIHYTIMRSRNTSSLQKRLGKFGLSRLILIEPHIMASLLTTQAILKSMLGEKATFPKHTLSFAKSSKLLKKNVKELLGYRSKGRKTRIMVTLPVQASDDYQLVYDMISSGMNCARINCSAGNEESWQKMVLNVKEASKQLKKNCKIAMDLNGPKIRVDKILRTSKIMKVQNMKDSLGNTIKPIKVYFGEGAENPVLPVIPLRNYDKTLIKVEDVLSFFDSRSNQREIKVTRIDENGFLGELEDTTHFETDLPILKEESELFLIGELAEKNKPLYLNKDDDLIIVKEESIPDTCPDKIPRVTCTEPKLFGVLRVGEIVLFDDGVIEGMIMEITENEITIRITKVPHKGGKLKARKGINFPNSDLRLNSLSDHDLEILPYVIRNTDVINMSFVNRASDVTNLLELIKQHEIEHTPGLILKIETKTAIYNLTEIILEAMQIYPIGMMIARGDLAVEFGWESIGNIQEEILSTCKAAHITSIWATQVLENLAKKGIPSRAEITDTIMAQRADCIMLNKGNYILQAIDLLSVILKRMKKKSTTLKVLQV